MKERMTMMLMGDDLQSIHQARTLIQQAKIAQKQLAQLNQDEIDDIVRAISEASYAKREQLAKMASDETGFGVWADKVIKNSFASVGVYEAIKSMKTIGVINEDKSEGIVEVAVPVGVIVALIPSTNPTSTVINKALISIKTGNAVVFSPHPNALSCIMETINILIKAAEAAGCPPGVISCLTIPTLEGTEALMKHRDTSLILATGGAGMVKAAYSSGKPAIGVGPGNGPAFIDRSADISEAVSRIIKSKSFDHSVVCSSEQSVVMEESIKEEVYKIGRAS